MATIKLTGCAHRKTETYHQEVEPRGATFISATCLFCFQRLRKRVWAVGAADGWKPDGKWEPDVPSPQTCPHWSITGVSCLKPIETKYAKNKRALCFSCGSVLEHPDGPGEWTPVLYYGYEIQEEPW